MSYDGIRHRKRVNKGDTADATQVQARHWMDGHAAPSIVLMTIMPYREVWSGSISGAREEIGRGAMRTHVDLTYVGQVRCAAQVGANVDPADPSYYAPEFSIDEGVTWAALDGAAGPALLLAGFGDLLYGYVVNTDWVRVSPLARRDVLMRWICSGPSFQTVSALTLFGRANDG